MNKDYKLLLTLSIEMAKQSLSLIESGDLNGALENANEASVYADEAYCAIKYELNSNL